MIHPFLSPFAGLPPRCWDHFDAVLNCSELNLGHTLPNPDEKESLETTHSVLELGISAGKKGRFDLMKRFSEAEKFLVDSLRKGSRTLICCENGHDVSVVVTVGILSKYFDENGQFCERERPSAEITKQVIRKRLHFVMKYRHMASPLRSLMRALNSYLMSGDFGQGGVGRGGHHGDEDDDDDE